MPGRIDMHTHCLGGAVADLFAAGFRLIGGYQISAQWTAQTALDYMDRQGIQTHILSVPWSLVGTADDPGRGRRFCRQVNGPYAQIIAAHAGRFSAFAAIPADNPDSALAEVRCAVDELHLDCVLLHSNAAGGESFGSAFYEPVLAELAHRRVPAFVHPTNSPCIERLAFGRSASVVEFTFDTTRDITNAIYIGVFRRHPTLTLILAHCGGALPMLGWRIHEHTEIGMGPDDADIDPAHVAHVLRGLYYETALVGAADALLPVLEVAAADHVLLGTDWPVAPEATVGGNTANLMTFAGFSRNQLSVVERDNAPNLFHDCGDRRSGSRPLSAPRSRLGGIRAESERNRHTRPRHTTASRSRRTRGLAGVPESVSARDFIEETDTAAGGQA